ANLDRTGALFACRNPRDRNLAGSAFGGHRGGKNLVEAASWELSSFETEPRRQPAIRSEDSSPGIDDGDGASRAFENPLVEFGELADSFVLAREIAIEPRVVERDRRRGGERFEQRPVSGIGRESVGTFGDDQSDDSAARDHRK